MSNTHEKIDDLLESLEEQKKNLIAASLVAKAELLDGLESLQEKLDDVDTDEIRMKLMLAKIKVLEEWDEVEEKFETLGSKAKEIALASESEIKEGWEAAKDLAGDVEERVKKYFS
jgi:hypothetical protein